MTSITDQPRQVEPAPTREAERRSGLLVGTWILAIAVAGLAAWIIYDQVVESRTGVTGEIQTLMDDYLAAWNEHDDAAFLSLVTDDFELGRPGEMLTTAEEQAAIIRGSASIGASVEAIGEPIMHGDGPWYVSQANVVKSSFIPAEGYEGLSVLTIVERDGDLLIRRHVYFGRS